MMASIPAFIALAQDKGESGSSKATAPPLRNKQYNYTHENIQTMYHCHINAVLTAPELPPIVPTTFAIAMSASRGLSHTISPRDRWRAT